MALQIFRNFFQSPGEVLDDIKRTGFWPTTLIAPASPELPLHWTLDGKTGERIMMQPGDKLIVPAGALHAEGDSPEPMTYIVALPEARPMDKFLTLEPPETAPGNRAGAGNAGLNADAE